MKMVRHWYQSVRAYVRLRTIAFVLIAGVLAAVAAPPAWWAGRLATNTKAQDDYAPLNQGQLKNLVRAAVEELNEKLPGGAGGTLAGMVASWAHPTAKTDDYAAVNIGQIKAAAALVYDRCMEAGYVTETQYPWDNSAFPPDDYALANIGQAKNLFAFDLATRTFSAYRSPGGDGIAYQWKLQYGLDPNNPNLASEIAPGGITYLQKYQMGLNPTTADSDGDGDSDGDEIAGGTNPKDPASRLAHAAVEVAIHSSVTQATSTFGGGPLGTFHEVLPPTPFGGSGSAVFSVDDPMNPGETITIMDGLDMGQMGEYDWGVALATSRPEVDYEHAEWKTDWVDSTEVLVDVNGNPFRHGSWSGTYHYLTEDIDPGMTVQTGVWVRNDRIASVPPPRPDDAYEHAGAWMAWGEYKFTDLPYGDIGIGVETTSTAFNLVRGAWLTMKIDASLDEATRKLYTPSAGPPYIASTSADGKYGNRVAFWIKTDSGKPAGADITRSYVKVTTSAPSPGGSTPDPVIEAVQLIIQKGKTSSIVKSLVAAPGKTVSLLPVEMKWEAIDGWDNVDDNKSAIDFNYLPNTPPPDGRWLPGRGRMVFPDKKSKDDYLRNQAVLKIHAAANVSTGNKVYLKAFDVDDATPDEFDTNHEIDLDRKGNDNKDNNASRVKTGQFIVGGQKMGATTELTLDANGDASVIFESTLQPGDNFRVALAFKQADLTPLQVDNSTGSAFVDGNSDQQPSGFAGVVSPMLTVWRKLNIEVDSMAAVPSPRGAPDEVAVEGSQWDIVNGKVNLWVTRNGQLPFNNFYTGGTISNGVHTLEIVESTRFRVAVAGTENLTDAQLLAFIGPIVLREC